jgi:hypothetical protein
MIGLLVAFWVLPRIVGPVLGGLAILLAVTVAIIATFPIAVGALVLVIVGGWLMWPTRRRRACPVRIGPRVPLQTSR